jgi:hypothetical protein
MTRSFYARILPRFFTLCLAIGAIQAPFAEADNLVTNGDFSKLNAVEYAVGWSSDSGQGVRFEAEAGQSFLAIENDNAKKQITIKQTIELDPSIKHLTLSAKLRSSELVVGEKYWQAGRIGVLFLDKQGETIEWGKGLRIGEPTDGWQQLSIDNEVPAGTAAVTLYPGLFFATGDLQVTDIELKEGKSQASQAPAPTKPAAAPAPKPKADGDPQIIRNAKAGENALPDPSFDGQTTGHQWTLKGSGAKIADGVLRVENSNPKAQHMAVAMIAIDPDWRSMKVSARMRVPELTTGGAHWQTARVAFTYLDDNEQVIKYQPALAVREPGEDWVTLEDQHDVMPGATVLRVEAGLFLATGVAEIDDLVAEPQGPAPDPQAYWGQEPIEVESPLRATVCLNGP